MLNEKIILASRSPRRAEILRAVGWDFEAIAADIDETRNESEAAVAYVKRLAQTKAETVARKTAAPLVLGADTVVVIDNEILGQPRDDEDARRMLRLLSARWHEVLTGVALVRADALSEVLIDHATTRVRFAAMSEAEIDWYVATGEPRGKAGAYGIQGPAALFIEAIEGEYFNVVGLPVRLVLELSQRLTMSDKL
jgi:nucleoside triphosphate pyrophosphatase